MGSSCVLEFTQVRPEGLCFDPGWLGSLRCALEVAEFLRGRCVHSCTSWVSFGVALS